MDYPALSRQISDWLGDYLLQSRASCFVVGVSGGIDSAVTSLLAAQTGAPTWVLNLLLHSQAQHTRLAADHCRSLAQRFANVRYLEQDLGKAYEALIQALEADAEPHPLAAANTKSRLRMTALYYQAGKCGGLVVGTGNKVEDFGVGFFTKYGDGGVDLSPIADLTKTQVRELAKVLQVSAQIVAAPPTDGLWGDARSDEQQLGASYEQLEWAMQAEQQGLVPSSPQEQEVVQIYRHFHSQNRHKMIDIPIFRLPKEKLPS